MNVLDSLRLIIYRFHEKGLEIFTVKEDEIGCSLPAKYLIDEHKLKLIELDPIQLDGEEIKAYAIEGDWHQIPSIRNLLKQDAKIAAGKVIEKTSSVERGTYIAIKEAIKKAVPHEYNWLKELKDILVDRNLVKNI